MIEIIKEVPIHNRFIETQPPQDIRTAYGDKVADTIETVVHGPEEAVQQLWEKYREKIAIAEPDYDGDRAYFSTDAGDFGVTQNIDASAQGSPFASPYEVAFHEFGHNIDNAMNQDLGNGQKDQFFSETYKGGLLGKTAKAEAAALIEDYRKSLSEAEGRAVSYEEACEHLSEELRDKIPLMERGDLSDILEGATNGDVCLGVGHGMEYWEDMDNGIEVFAELFSASICNFGSLNTIKEYFPETYKVFQEMVRLA